METELKKDVGKYRLLYFQPNPEDGERVCVGLLFEERRSRSVVYDDKFQKVRCIAPSYEPELMKFYLDDLDSTLQNSEDDLTLILRRYGPQLVASEERLVSLPLTDTTRFSLLERFVARGGRPTAELTAVVAKAPSSDEFGERIRKYVQQYVRPTDVRIIPNARPRDLFDYPLPDLRPVALAIRKPGKTILIDGVDLRISGKQQAVDRANRVAYTFWQYGRVRSENVSLLQTPFSRIGVLLDGSTRRTKAYYEAHDFALHQFQKEADIAVDTTSGQGTRELEEMLSSVG